MSGDSQYIFEDMKVMALGISDFADAIEQTSIEKFGKAGTVAQVVGGFVESYNTVRSNLSKLANSNDIKLSVQLQNFAKAIGVDKDTFTIKNEALNFNVNVEVKIDADQLIEIMSDTKKVGDPLVTAAQLSDD